MKPWTESIICFRTTFFCCKCFHIWNIKPSMPWTYELLRNIKERRLLALMKPWTYESLDLWIFNTIPGLWMFGLMKPRTYKSQILDELNPWVYPIHMLLPVALVGWARVSTISTYMTILLPAVLRPCWSLIGYLPRHTKRLRLSGGRRANWLDNTGSALSCHLPK